MILSILLAGTVMMMALMASSLSMMAMAWVPISMPHAPKTTKHYSNYHQQQQKQQHCMVGLPPTKTSTGLYLANANFNNNNNNNNKKKTILLPTTTTTSSSSSPLIDRQNYRQAIQDPYNVATLLLGILLERRAEELRRFSFDTFLTRLTTSYSIQRQEQIRRIEQLILQLIQSSKSSSSSSSSSNNNNKNKNTNTPPLWGRSQQQNIYDPTESLLGPLFCTLYYFTPSPPPSSSSSSTLSKQQQSSQQQQQPPPKPLWDQLSNQKRSNLKGQQYFITKDFDPAVINYAELNGRDLYLQAYGTFVPFPDLSIYRKIPSSSSSSSSSSQKDIQPTMGKHPQENDSKSWIPSWRWFFPSTTSTTTTTTAAGKGSNHGMTRNQPRMGRFRTCPDTFQVEVSSVSLHLGTMGISIGLPISGTSFLVVLYADPRIRILVSLSSTKTNIGPAWENAGLIVVQVRSDLVTGTNPIDLR